MGMVAGDRLLKINRHEINDVLDYWFHGAGNKLNVEWQSVAGELRKARIQKHYDEKLGIELEPFEIRWCSNHCVFCFVHQLPPGMRRELYLKDEDYRLSFLYGNYVTGTNLSPADKARIIEYKLSPLYFSIHATDQEIRERLLVKNGIEPIIPLLQQFTKENIYIHCQVVLCPGINDRAVLEQTVADLSALYPHVESMAVVPLGLTNHRARLPQLDTISPEYARAFISHCEQIQKKTLKTIGYPLVFPSDEWFLIARIEPPNYDEYPEIPQLANGVGMYYKFYDGVDELIGELPESLPEKRRVAAITTHMGLKVLQRLVDMIHARVSNLEVVLLPTENTLFGAGITVTGLLPGADFKRQIEENPGFDAYLIPRNALRVWDQRFLDDMTFVELCEQTGVPIVTGADTAADFVTACLPACGCGS